MEQLFYPYLVRIYISDIFYLEAILGNLALKVRSIIIVNL